MREKIANEDEEQGESAMTHTQRTLYIQVVANRVDYYDGALAPGIQEGEPLYFYYPLGDYDSAIQALLDAGFTQGPMRPPARP